MVLYQMLLHDFDLITMEVEKSAAFQALPMHTKPLAAFVMPDVLETCRRILVDYVLIHKTFFDEAFQLAVHCGLTDFFLLRFRKMVVYLRRRDMSALYRLQIFQHLVMLLSIVLAFLVHLSSFDCAGCPA